MTTRSIIQDASFARGPESRNNPSACRLQVSGRRRNDGCLPTVDVDQTNPRIAELVLVKLRKGHGRRLQAAIASAAGGGRGFATTVRIGVETIVMAAATAAAAKTATNVFNTTAPVGLCPILHRAAITARGKPSVT
jgi:hypothetical protein